MEEEQTLNSSNSIDNANRFMNLPKDIHLSIFSTLPFESYITCRAVCKQWRRFFSDPDFARNPQIPKVIFRSDSRSFCSIDFQGKSLKPSPRSLSVKSHEYYRIYGSCNGLLCVAIDCNGQYKIALWNPSTGDCRILPDANPVINTKPDFSNHFTSSLVGFGYDSFSDDYKIVRVFLGKVDVFVLFSLKTNSWNVMTPFAPPLNKLGFCFDNVGTTINKRIYWLLSSEPLLTGKLVRWVVAFDLKENRFVEIDIPLCDAVNSYDSVKITTIGNHVGLCCYSNINCCLTIWGMHKDSWVKLILVSIDDVKISSSASVTLKQICFNENDGKLLFHIVDYLDMKNRYPGLLVYDTKLNRTERFILFHRGICQRYGYIR